MEMQPNKKKKILDSVANLLFLRVFIKKKTFFDLNQLKYLWKQSVHWKKTSIILPAIHSIEANTERQMTRYFISGCWFSDAINEVWLDNEHLFNRPTQCT